MPETALPLPPCCDACDPAAAAPCALCGRAVCPVCVSRIAGRVICPTCHEGIKAEIAAEKASAARLPGAAAGGLLGAAAGGALWALVTILSQYEVAFVALAVGWLAGTGAVFGAGFRRGGGVQAVAVGCALAGLLAGKLLTIAYAAGRYHGVSMFDGELFRGIVRSLPGFLSWYDAVFATLALLLAWRVPLPSASTRRTRPAGAPGRTSAPALRRTGIAAALAAAAVFLVVRAKVLLTALKLGPLAATLATMAVSAWAYALAFGFPLAVGLVVVILLHELGHAAAARAVGLRTGAPVFIPFLGAAIALRDRPRSTAQGALVAAGGPLAGAICSGLALAVAAALPAGGTADFLRVLGWLTALLNLLNLAPVLGLDGSRMARAMGPLHLIGAVFGLVLAFALQHLVAEQGSALLAVLGALAVLRAAGAAWRAGRGGSRLLDRLRAVVTGPRDEDSVQPAARVAAAAGWCGLAVVLSTLALLVQGRLPAI